MAPPQAQARLQPTSTSSSPSPSSQARRPRRRAPRLRLSPSQVLRPPLRPHRQPQASAYPLRQTPRASRLLLARSRLRHNLAGFLLRLRQPPAQPQLSSLLRAAPPRPQACRPPRASRSRLPVMVRRRRLFPALRRSPSLLSPPPRPPRPPPRLQPFRRPWLPRFPRALQPPHPPPQRSLWPALRPARPRPPARSTSPSPSRAPRRAPLLSPASPLRLARSRAWPRALQPLLPPQMRASPWPAPPRCLQPRAPRRWASPRPWRAPPQALHLLQPAPRSPSPSPSPPPPRPRLPAPRRSARPWPAPRRRPPRHRALQSLRLSSRAARRVLPPRQVWPLRSVRSAPPCRLPAQPPAPLR